MLYLIVSAMSTLAAARRPNILLIMCDDLDTKLGSEVALPQTQRLLAGAGARAMNYFVSSPKCTPSRSAWLSGRHYHNLRPDGKMSGTGLNTTNFFDRDAVFPTMHRAGYKTAIFGKIHNNQASWLCTPKNHSEPFDHIETECKPCGGYYRVNKNDWVSKEEHGSTHKFETLDPADPFSNYSEAQYGNRTARWIRYMASAEPDTPWFAFIGTSGPHLGVVPAPWHRDATRLMKPHHAPRTPNFNVHAPRHHHLLAEQPALDEDAIAFVDLTFRDRLGTLLSIDDMVAGLVQTLDELALLKDTVIMFTSDHGYHLGQNRIPDEKVEPYETDIRVPFYLRYDAVVTPGTVLNAMVSNVDIGPTLAELAGLSPPNLMDGRSMLPLLAAQGTDAQKVEAARRLVAHPWRTHMVVEFAEAHLATWGTNAVWNATDEDPTTDLTVHPPFGPNNCSRKEECVGKTFPNGTRMDYEYITPDYNWRLLRVLNETDDFMFVQYDKGYTFKPSTIDTLFAEFYDIRNDSWQQHNLWPILDAAKRRALQAELALQAVCGGTRSRRSNCSGSDAPPAPTPPTTPPTPPPPPSPGSPTPVPAPPIIKPARYMPHANVVGNPEQHPCKAVEYIDARKCEGECDDDAKCLAWVMHFSKSHNPGDPTWRCCMKTSWSKIESADKNTTSGIKYPPNATALGAVVSSMTPCI